MRSISRFGVFPAGTALALAGVTIATPGEMFPIDTILVADSTMQCVNHVDLNGDPWFLAGISDIHPDLPPMPFPEGLEFRVTGQYCVDCVEVFCGSFDGFIFGANLSPAVVGDVDADGTVGILDMLALLSQWGPCPQTDSCAADLDADGAVGISDLLMLLANWD